MRPAYVAGSPPGGGRVSCDGSYLLHPRSDSGLAARTTRVHVSCPRQAPQGPRPAQQATGVSSASGTGVLVPVSKLQGRLPRDTGQAAASKRQRILAPERPPTGALLSTAGKNLRGRSAERCEMRSTLPT